MIDAVMPTYARTNFAFVKGEGMYVWTDDGRRFLDFGAGIAVNALGHCHPHLVEKLNDQIGKLWHVSNLYRIPGQEELAQRLVDNSFADSVFFNNSGAEALEMSIKMVRKYHHDAGHPEKFRILCCDGAFHGRTMATIAAGGQPKYLEGFGPKLEGFDHVPFGNLNAMRAAVTEETGAILVEPIQGEGGIRSADMAYLQGLRAICDEFGLLLVLDEVQCGNGRTGKLYAHEWADIEPDVMATAKGLGSGFPVGAVLAKEGPATAMKAGTHGSTFGGNPLAMAAANGVLDVLLEPGFLEAVDRRARYFWEKLAELVTRYPTIFEAVRGQGLMVGMKCTVPNGKVVQGLLDRGVLTVPAGDNVVRMVPPLIVEEAHIDACIDALAATCDAILAEGEQEGSAA